MNSPPIFYVSALFAFFSMFAFESTLAVGGVAEMKALTGDAPYLGFGNQEQAPEYFGEAAYRQYYSNPSYGYAPAYGGYSGFRSPYRGYGISRYLQGAGYPGGIGGIGGVGGATPYLAGAGPPGGSVGLGNALGGGIYHGGGNEWVNKN